jgi:hypothetical protein
LSRGLAVPTRIIHKRFCCICRDLLKRDGRDLREKRDSKLEGPETSNF